MIPPERQGGQVLVNDEVAQARLIKSVGQARLDDEVGQGSTFTGFKSKERQK
jgi:hypothetical protein